MRLISEVIQINTEQEVVWITTCPAHSVLNRHCTANVVLQPVSGYIYCADTTAKQHNNKQISLPNVVKNNCCLELPDRNYLDL